jgi:hypothetical protein
MNPLLVLICIDILMAISFYLPFSAGDLSVLPIGTMAIAAYSFALYTQDPEASLLTGAAIGFVFGTVAALLGGLLMLRLSGFASALTSFGLVVVIQTFFTNWERSRAFSSGSERDQNGCLAIVLGTSDPASSTAPSRRQAPSARTSRAVHNRLHRATGHSRSHARAVPVRVECDHTPPTAFR